MEIVTKIQELINTKFSKFSFIGIFNVLFSLSLHYLLLEIIKVNIYISFSIVFFITVGVAYLLNSRYTFKKKISINRAIKFYGTYLLNLLIGLILIFAIKQLSSGFSDFIVTVLSMPPRLVLSFFIVNFYVFKD